VGAGVDGTLNAMQIKTHLLHSDCKHKQTQTPTQTETTPPQKKNVHLDRKQHAYAQSSAQHNKHLRI
jgi:hypothetical protein